MKSYRGIGIMSGTSLDGVDMVCCDFRESDSVWDFEMVAAESVGMDEQWQVRLMHVHEQSAEIYAKTHVYFGHYLGRLTANFIHTNELKPDFVASHGQTVFHQPGKNFTAQIGDGESMVSHLNCPLVCNFRNKDVALGGQGAPLVPFGEKFLFSGYDFFLNLGGFGNISQNLTAFDTSPCNFVLNRLAQLHDPPLPFDPDGQIAARGKLIPELLEDLNAMEYFTHKPPKSLGREWVEQKVLPLLNRQEAAVPDLLRTYIEHIAIQTAAAIRWLDRTSGNMLITGGGVHNSCLMGRLKDHFSRQGIQISEDVPETLVDFKEAIIFAFLGLHTLIGKPNVLTSVTGAKTTAPGGSIHLPPGTNLQLL